jgi:hypothetical protein
VTTHAPELLDDEGVRPDEVLVLRVTQDGSTADVLQNIAEVEGELTAQLPISDTVNGLIAPRDLAGLIVVGQGKRR